MIYGARRISSLGVHRFEHSRSWSCNFWDQNVLYLDETMSIPEGRGQRAESREQRIEILAPLKLPAETHDAREVFLPVGKLHLSLGFGMMMMMI